MNCMQWRLAANDEVPSWHDRDDYLDRIGPRALLWTGELRGAHSWSWGSAAICMALRGRVLATSRGVPVELAHGDVLLAEAGASLHLDPGTGDARVLILWLPPTTPRGRAAPELLPAFYAHDAELTSALTQLVQSGEPGVAPDLSQVLALIADRQHELDPNLANCPGRSDRHRRQLFSRLLRAKNLIDHGQAVPLDLAALAQTASLSPSHFLRLFHRVFGVSPHRYLVQQRMLRARRMVMETAVPIGTIAQRLGFINRCAFARLFKQHFGTPATRLRRQTLVQSRPPALRSFVHGANVLRPVFASQLGAA